MKILVLYDSKFGNTEKLALSMGEALAATNDVAVQRVDSGQVALAGYDMALIGGPTHGHGASAPLKEALGAIPRGAASGVKVALFDTRFRMNRFLTGSAASAAAKLLKHSGAVLVAEGESFFVTRGGGSVLEDGEVERAAAWAARVSSGG